MRPSTCAALGLGLLLAAQGLATAVIAPRRADITPNREVYAALTPGEFAGTLMLGGFRGLACDLLWMRASSAKEAGRFYESVALFEAISRIQPRFEQSWQYMAWDLAYNLSHEVDDHAGKWAWVDAGLAANIRGCERNPQSEKLLRHLAWMFHHKGDLFHDSIEARPWAARINPVIAEVNARILPAFRVEPLPEGTGLSNFQIASRLYQACVALADGDPEHQRKLSAEYIRRMIPLGIEFDGNLKRNQGRHLLALIRWIDALEAWRGVERWAGTKGDASNQQLVALQSLERNEGRLRRKAAQVAAELAPDKTTALETAMAIDARRFDEVRRLLEKAGWKDVAGTSRFRWLDE